MSRIVFFVLLALAIYLVWRLMQKKRLPPNANSSIARLPMVSCATCGLHVPREEALMQGERYFCCEEHRSTPPPRE
ncbi:MAG TPA: PP0621 family protein [Burkholderiaceae bacterium]|nr:PP0621 family protein [Burkholderiaceae bacterium]